MLWFCPPTSWKAFIKGIIQFSIYRFTLTQVYFIMNRPFRPEFSFFVFCSLHLCKSIFEIMSMFKCFHHCLKCKSCYIVALCCALTKKWQKLPEKCDFGGFWWILVGFGGFWWILVDFDEFWWILVDFGGLAQEMK